MSSDLEWVALGEMIEYQKGYAFSSDEYSDTGCPIVRVSDFTADSISHQTEKAISPSLAQAYFRFALEEGDIVIATVGSWGTNPNSVVGKTIRVPKEVKGSLLNQNAVRIRAKNRKSQDFLFYSLKDKSFSDYIVACAQGSANQASITLSDIFRYEIADYSPDEHRARAAILRCIDDKIELNRKTNETLEAMAKSLFKSWFVDFDPVRAKAEGRSTGLPAEISDLFPDSFEDSELGEIPSGWRVGLLDQIGINPRETAKPEEMDSSDRYIGLGHMPRGSICLGEAGQAEELESNKNRFRKGDLLFGKLRPYFKKTGYCQFNGVCSTDIVVVRKKGEYGVGFICCFLASDPFIDFTVAASSGTRMPRTSWKDMCEFPFAIPSHLLLREFDKQFRHVINKITGNCIHSGSLAVLRDALLPKLISGEIRIPDAEKMLEEVGI